MSDNTGATYFVNNEMGLAVSHEYTFYLTGNPKPQIDPHIKSLQWVMNPDRDDCPDCKQHTNTTRE